MRVTRHTVQVTTAADGSATAYSPVVNGRVLAVIYTKTEFDNGVTFAITAENSGLSIWSEAAVNADATRYPKAQNHSTAGAALTGVYDHIPLSEERVKIVIASGGNAKTGTFDVLVGG